MPRERAHRPTSPLPTGRRVGDPALRRRRAKGTHASARTTPPGAEPPPPTLPRAHAQDASANPTTPASRARPATGSIALASRPGGDADAPGSGAESSGEPASILPEASCPSMASGTKSVAVEEAEAAPSVALEASVVRASEPMASTLSLPPPSVGGARNGADRDGHARVPVHEADVGSEPRAVRGTRPPSARRAAKTRRRRVRLVDRCMGRQEATSASRRLAPLRCGSLQRRAGAATRVTSASRWSSAREHPTPPPCPGRRGGNPYCGGETATTSIWMK
jgi:hypothetical protein